MSDKDNLFKKIIRGEIPAEKVYEDDEILVFKDLYPIAPIHLLIIPKAPIDSLDELTDDDALIAGKLILRASKLAKELGIANDGYRVVINTNDDGGQSVPHLHVHLIGGRQFKWPPG